MTDTWPRVIRIGFYLLFILVPLIFLPFNSELFEFNKIVVTYILTVIIVGAWAARMISARRFIFVRTPLDWPLVIFLAIQLISLVFSIDRHVSFLGYYSRWNGGWLSLASYSLLYWAFVSNLDRQAALTVIRCAVVTTIPIALWGAAEHFGVDASWWVQDVKTRVFSTLGQPNWLAAYLAALFFVPLAYLQAKFNWLWLGTSVLLYLVFLFTGSRSGMLGLGVGSTVFWAAMFLKDRSAAIWPGLVFGLAAATLAVVTPGAIRDFILRKSAPPPPQATAPATTSLETGITESADIRKIVWAGARRIWRGSTKNFWLGTGPETFAMAYYQYRPVEHNLTSEWELLYNKAHNEFLNYLATTGLLGVVSYLLLIAFMLKILTSKGELEGESWPLKTALFAGWSSIIVTNYWGFSVVIVQLFLFLFPAVVIVLGDQSGVLSTQGKEKRSAGQVVGLVVVLAGCLWLLFSIGKYWWADVSFASGQNNYKGFQKTQDVRYLLASYHKLAQATRFNPDEPTITSEYAVSAAYLSLALKDSDATASASLVDLSLAAVTDTLATSPNHPNYYKSASRAYILLSEHDPRYLQLAADALAQARQISPTDPRLSYNQGVIAYYLNATESAKMLLETALQLKPDFADARRKYAELTTNSQVQKIID